MRPAPLPAFIVTFVLAFGSPSVTSAQAATDTASLVGARSPSYAPDGRLALSMDGHLMLQRTPGARLVALTSGSAWDRDPAWTPDGLAIVFASDRGGNYDLWRVAVNVDGTAGVLTQLTSTPQQETSPSVAGDGRIAFLRGSGNASRVWVMDAAGKAARVTTGGDTERSPQFSPKGTFLAFLTVNEAGRRLSVWSMAPNATASQRWTQAVDASADYLSWAWDRERLAVSTRTGVFIVPRIGGYSNFLSTARGQTAWSPDDKTVAIASFEETNVGYNGDPDRGSDRSAVVRASAGAATERLTFATAPVAPNITSVQRLAGGDSRADRNAAAFDRVWDRSARLYFSQADATARRAQWESIKTSLRPRAMAASTDSALEAVIHEALKARPTLREPASGRAAVSSAHPVATEAGLEILRKGGNVVDAAVAVSFALGVVEPDASGIAGYGEMVIALKTLAKPTLFEFMSRVPEDAGLSNTSLLVNGRYPSDGPVLTNVPGTVSGMHTAWLRYGSKKVPWAEIVAPAIRAAKNGYVVSEGLATTLATEREHFAKYEGSRALFFRNGEPLQAGDTLKNPDLAWVLEQIAKNGADGFYKGEVAAKWVNDLHAKGNAMKLSDLARYFAPEREPVSGTYRHYTIYSGAPPVSGGAELVARLNLLEQYPAPTSYRDNAASMHAALSAWFLVPSSRNRIADPAMWPTDVAPIINKDTARVRWGCYNPDRALTPESVRGDTLGCLKERRETGDGRRETTDARRETEDSPCGEGHAAEMTVCHAAGTTAFTVADNDGNMVAVTQTLGTWGGNFYVTPGLGFLSNDKLTSYGTDPTQYGARLPFSRHGSTIAPTIAFKNGKPFVAVSAAGNAWITSAVYQSLLGVLDYNLSPQQALELPRFLPGGGGAPGGGRGGGGGAPTTPTPYSIQLEDGFAPDVIARLRTLGYGLSFVSLRGEVREGYGAAVRVDGKIVTAGADPRRAGAAGAIK
ncbi:MAG: gamma-glutamyltransferase [Gemmatimonadaceae bacterium]|nr:gamma-glutamyltransferase [Gemmatimonadaceae bacterium]